jgi:hypothetical protein
MPATTGNARRVLDTEDDPAFRDMLRWSGALAAAPRSYTAEDLGRIAVPTLWIAGEDEQFSELDQLLTMKRRIPGAELLIVNRAEHLVLLTHPHLVGLAIVDFLARQDIVTGPSQPIMFPVARARDGWSSNQGMIPSGSHSWRATSWLSLFRFKHTTVARPTGVFPPIVPVVKSIAKCVSQS